MYVNSDCRPNFDKWSIETKLLIIDPTNGEWNGSVYSKNNHKSYHNNNFYTAKFQMMNQLCENRVEFEEKKLYSWTWPFFYSLFVQ